MTFVMWLLILLVFFPSPIQCVSHANCKFPFTTLWVFFAFISFRCCASIRWKNKVFCFAFFVGFICGSIRLYCTERECGNHKDLVTHSLTKSIYIHTKQYATHSYKNGWCVTINGFSDCLAARQWRQGIEIQTHINGWCSFKWHALFYFVRFHPYSTAAQNEAVVLVMESVLLIITDRFVVGCCRSFTEIFSRMAVKISCLKYAKHVSHTVCISCSYFHLLSISICWSHDNVIHMKISGAQFYSI